MRFFPWLPKNPLIMNGDYQREINIENTERGGSMLALWSRVVAQGHSHLGDPECHIWPCFLTSFPRSQFENATFNNHHLGASPGSQTLWCPDQEKPNPLLHLTGFVLSVPISFLRLKLLSQRSWPRNLSIFPVRLHPPTGVESNPCGFNSKTVLKHNNNPVIFILWGPQRQYKVKFSERRSHTWAAGVLCIVCVLFALITRALTSTLRQKHQGKRRERRRGMGKQLKRSENVKQKHGVQAEKQRACVGCLGTTVVEKGVKCNPRFFSAVCWALIWANSTGSSQLHSGLTWSGTFPLGWNAKIHWLLSERS